MHLRFMYIRSYGLCARTCTDAGISLAYRSLVIFVHVGIGCHILLSLLFDQPLLYLSQNHHRVLDITAVLKRLINVFNTLWIDFEISHKRFCLNKDSNHLANKVLQRLTFSI